MNHGPALARVQSATISLDKIGEDGMAVVYTGERAYLDRPVALKFLPAHLLGDEELNRRFEREAKAAALRRALNVGSQPQRRAS